MRGPLKQLTVIAPAFTLFMPIYAGAVLTALRQPLWIVSLSSLLIFGLFYLVSWRWALIGVLCFYGSIVRTHIASLPSAYDWRCKIQRGTTSAQFKGIISDAPFILSEDSDITPISNRVIMELAGTRPYLSPRTFFWQKCTGRILLQYPHDMAIGHLSPGDDVEIRGTLTALPTREEPITGAYGQYLRTMGITGICRIDRIRPTHHPEKCFRILRRKLALALIDGMSDQGAIRSTLALGLGLPQYFTAETRQSQIASGAVHIFAISGMHVGVVVVIINLLMRCTLTPLRTRWLMAGFFIICYTILTGASPSSLRAMMMVLLVFYAHFRNRAGAWLNGLGVAGIVAVLITPYVVLHIGFQYSYLVVLTLMLRAPFVQSVLDSQNERFYWLPISLRSPFITTCRKMTMGALLVSIDAWLAGCVIALSSSQYLALCAPIVNIPLGLLAYFALALCPVKILVSMMLPDSVSLIFTSFFEGVYVLMDRLSCISATSATCRPVRQASEFMSWCYAIAFVAWLATTWILYAPRPPVRKSNTPP